MFLQEKKKFITLKNEKTLKAIQEKIQIVLGPLTRIWSIFDEERESNPNDEPLQEMGTCFEQTIMLLAQAINSVGYYRRENILSTCIESTSRVKEILKKEAKELDDPKNKCLFGEDFESKLLKDSKALKKSEAIFTGLSSNSSSGSNATSKDYNSNNNQPFRRGPLLQGGSRGQVFKNFRQNRGKTKGSIFSSLFKDPRPTATPSCASSGSKIIPTGIDSKSTCRKL